ncbi:hypothetical protein ABPG75_007867 [Micractinium tetrahymenae]
MAREDSEPDGAGEADKEGLPASPSSPDGSGTTVAAAAAGHSGGSRRGLASRRELTTAEKEGIKEEVQAEPHRVVLRVEVASKALARVLTYSVNVLNAAFVAMAIVLLTSQDLITTLQGARRLYFVSVAIGSVCLAGVAILLGWMAAAVRASLRERRTWSANQCYFATTAAVFLGGTGALVAVFLAGVAATLAQPDCAYPWVAIAGLEFFRRTVFSGILFFLLARLHDMQLWRGRGALDANPDHLLLADRPFRLRARSHLALPFCRYRATHIFVRVQARILLPVQLGVLLTILLLELVPALEGHCMSVVHSQLGNLPLQLSLTVSAAVLAILYMPKAKEMDSPVLQEFLQEFSWTEAAIPADLERRNQRLLASEAEHMPQGQSHLAHVEQAIDYLPGKMRQAMGMMGQVQDTSAALEQLSREPIFCMETAVRLYHWGRLAYRNEPALDDKYGCVERHNRTLKDTISALILAKPEVPSWVTHLWSVQKSVNNMPHAAHGGTMTAAQVLFGALEPAVLLPDPEELLSLMGLNSPAATAAAGDPNLGRSRGGGARSKRTAAAAELAELSDEEAELPDDAQLSDEEEALEAAATMAAMPARRSSRRAAAVGVEAAVAAEHGNDAQLGEAAPTRALPARAAAASSPAGKRRRLTAVLAAAEQAQAEAEQAQAAGPSTTVVPEAAGPSTAGQRSIVAAAIELAGQLPHLKAVREKATQQHEKNRARISRTRKGKGKQPPFTVGEDIVMQPARKGKAFCDIEGIGLGECESATEAAAVMGRIIDWAGLGMPGFNYARKKEEVPFGQKCPPNGIAVGFLVVKRGSSRSLVRGVVFH